MNTYDENVIQDVKRQKKNFETRDLWDWHKIIIA